MKAAIVAVAGPALAAAEAALFAEHPPAGVILFGRNIETPAQVARLVGDLRRALRPEAVLMVDQEGGRVARLRPPAWPAHPPAAVIGALNDPAAAARLAWLTGALIGLDCAAAGFDVVCAPVLDLLAPGATAAIGDRSYGSDPGRVVPLALACANGLLAAGIQPVGKHAPGHGRATVDSHLGLPRLSAAGMEPELQAFAACRALPWMMTAHIVYQGLDDTLPATLSPTIIATLIRGRIGFDGVLVSDDLAMGALAGPPGALARRALAAGCDLALHCSGQLEDTRAVLAAVPGTTPACLARLARARDQARQARTTLDRAALVTEQAALLHDPPCSKTSSSPCPPPSP